MLEKNKTFAGTFKRVSKSFILKKSFSKNIEIV